MRSLFFPDSILVIGVSPSPRNLGRYIVDNLLRFKFSGQIHLLGRRPGFYAGHPIYTNFDALPDGIDLAVMLTPAEMIVETLVACGRKGIRRAIIESGGFSELTGDDDRLDEEVLAVAREHGIRFVGPNGLGAICRASGMVSPFMPMDALPREGDISVLAQSGGVGVTYIAALWSENLGMDRFVSLGNKLSLDETDYLEHLSSEGTSRTVCFYLEDVRRGRAFYDAVRGFDGTVIVQRAGFTAAGHRAASSHTASLAVDDRVVDAAMRQAGAIRVQSMDQMITHAKVAALPPMRGNRLMIIARSGGHAVIAADVAEQSGFVMPPLPPEMARVAAQAGRGQVIRTDNPLDLGDVFDFDVYKKLLFMAAESAEFDGVVLIQVFSSEAEVQASARLLEPAAHITEATGKPVYLCLITVPLILKGLKRHTPLPLFDAPETMIEAMSALRRVGARRRDRDELRVDRTGDPAPALGADAASGGRSRYLNAAAAWGLLERWGFPVARWRVVTRREDLADACAAVGYPVVLKADSDDLVHKSDVGGVEVGLEDQEAAMAAYDRIHAAVAAAAPTVSVDGVLVQAMVRGGREVFLGGRRDPSFGPLIMTGVGGVYVETLGDVSLRLAPLSRRDVTDLIDEVSWFKTLAPVRGQPGADRSLLEDQLLTLSAMLCAEEQVEEIDINPLLLGNEGEGGTIVDVRIRLRQAEIGAEAPPTELH